MTKKEKLEKLHEKLAEYYIAVLEEGEELSSGTLSAINAFLKTNRIVVDDENSSELLEFHKKLESLMEEI